MGETIAVSVYNMPFKPLGILSGRVKSCEGLPTMTPTNIFSHYVIGKHELSHKHTVLPHKQIQQIEHYNLIIRTSKRICGQSRQHMFHEVQSEINI